MVGLDLADGRQHRPGDAVAGAGLAVQPQVAGGDVGDRGPARAWAGRRPAWGPGPPGPAPRAGPGPGRRRRRSRPGRAGRPGRRCRAAPAPGPGPGRSSGPTWLGRASEADVQVPLVAGVGEPGPAPEAPGRADLARLHPGPAAADPQGQPAGRGVGRADRAAVDLVDVDGAPDEWLETRRVPLTYQEWPVRRHDTRIRWRSAAATSSRADPAVQPRGPVVAGGSAASGVGEAQPRRRPGGRRGSGARGRGDGREPAGDQAADRRGVGGGQRGQDRDHDQDGQPTTGGGTARRRRAMPSRGGRPVMRRHHRRLAAQGPPAALADPVDRPQPLGRGRVLSAAAAGLAGGGALAGLAVGRQPGRRRR